MKAHKGHSGIKWGTDRLAEVTMLIRPKKLLTSASWKQQLNKRLFAHYSADCLNSFLSFSIARLSRILSSVSSASE